MNTATPQAKALSSYTFPGLGGPMPASAAKPQTGAPLPTAQVSNNLAPPSNAQVTSHTTTDAAGNTTKQTFAPQSPGLVNPAQNQASVTPGGAVATGSQPQTFPGLIGTVASQGAQQSPITQQASKTAGDSAAEYQRLNKQIGDTRLAEAGALEHQGLAPIPMGDITGRQAVIRQQYESRLAGLGAQAQGATNLFGPSISAATTGQGQQYSQAQNAANLAQPQLGAFGQGYYNPLDTNGGAAGAGGGALNPINNISSLAQQVISGQISPQQAYAMGGSVPNFQGALNAAIQQANPGFNTANAQGEYDARQANTTTAGTAVTNANAAAYAQNLNPYYQLQNTVQNVDQFGNLLLQTMQQGGINPSDLKYANSTIANIRSQLSSQQQAQFDNTYASLKSRVSGLLATGGSEIPTQITTDANKILDGSLPLGALNAVLSRISTEGQILLQNQANLVNKPLQTAGGSTAGKVGTPASDYDSYLRSIGL